MPYQTGKALSRQVSGTLDKVLFESGYDRQIRPGVRKSLSFRESQFPLDWLIFIWQFQDVCYPSAVPDLQLSQQNPADVVGQQH